MPIRQSRAFVLRSFPLSETAKGVILFSEDEGKIKGWAHGARRPNSRFGSSLDLGNEVQLEWRERETREWVNLNHCDLLVSALPLMRDPLAAATLHYHLGLVDVFAPGRDARPRLYRLVRACLGALREHTSPLLVAAYFEAWLLRLSGLYPRPGRCGCGAGFREKGAAFRPSGPAWFCPDCAPGERPGDLALSPAALELLAAMWASPPTAVQDGSRTVADRTAAEELFRLHRGMVGAAAGREIPGREGLVRVLNLIHRQ